MALESLFSTPLDPVDEDACRETASDKAFPLRPLKKERKHWERDNLGNRVKANELEHADYPSGFNDRSTSDIDLNPHCDMKKAEAIAVKKEYVEDTHVDMSEPAFLDEFNSPPCSDAGVHNSHGAYGAETGKPCPFPRMFMKRGSKRGKATHHVWAQEMGFSHCGQGRGWHNPGRGRSTMRRGRGRGPEGRGMWRGGRGRAAGREWETDYVFQLRRYKEEQEATVAAPFIQKEQNKRGGCGTFQSKTAEHLSVNNKKFKKRRRNAMKMSEPKLKKQRVVCSFYMEGRCNKGDLCSFSHDAEPLKKKEPCKFYAGGSCGKGEKCLYMHDDFPCKFFHTGTNCFQGDLCRFSHQPLTDETRLILQKVLNVPENAEDLNDPDAANGVMHSMDNEVSFGLDHFETLPHQMVFFQRSQSDESKDGVLSPQSNSASSPKSRASGIVEQCAARHKSITRLQPKTEAQTIKWPSNLKLSQERVKTEVNVSSLSVSFSQLPPVTGLPAESTVRTISILREEPVMIPLDSCAKYNFHDPRLERLSPSCGVSTPPAFPKPPFAVGFVLDPEVSSSQVINDSDTGGAFLGSETWDRAPCRVMPMSTTQAPNFVPLALNEGPLTSDKTFANTSQYWGAQNPHKDKTVTACDLLMAQTSASTSPEALSSPPADAQATDCVVAVHSLPVRPVPSSRNLRSLRRDAATPTLPSNQEGQSDSVSIKEVFKFSDPTASPFC